jgi:hypothetical protein
VCFPSRCYQLKRSALGKRGLGSGNTAALAITTTPRHHLTATSTIDNNTATISTTITTIVIGTILLQRRISRLAARPMRRKMRTG